MGKWHKATISDFVFAIITVFILSFVSVSYVWVLANVEALKALIEAEATILGFFGLVAVYWLTSLDSRIDRLEQEKHEYKMRGSQIKTNLGDRSIGGMIEMEDLLTGVTNLENRISETQKKKESVASEASIIGIFLFVSIVACIGLLGFQSAYADALKNLDSPLAQLVGFASGIPMMLFLESTWFIFSLFRRMGKRPKEKAN